MTKPDKRVIINTESKTKHKRKGKEKTRMMTEKEMNSILLTIKGMKVSEIGNTLQWTTEDGRTCIQYFTEDGEWIKNEFK